MVKRIAVIGPESTGKSTLCNELALYYHTLWVPEYAREYIGNLNRSYTLDDIQKIAKTQTRMEEEATLKANKLLFIDTELIVAKVWCEDVFNTCPQWISDKITRQRYNYYFLTMPDLPWQPDPLRENENRREHFFRLYEQELIKRGFSYSVIAGKGIERLKSAIAIVNTLIAV